MSYELHHIPRQQMIDKTVAAMKVLIERAKESYDFVNFARNLVNQCNGHEFGCEVQLIFNFVQSQIRYVRDPFGIELVSAPFRTLQIKCGDCDDKTVLFCALAESVGHKTRIVLESMNGRGWSHVRADVFLNGKWISADCTPENKPFGWMSPAVKKRAFVN